MTVIHKIGMDNLPAAYGPPMGAFVVQGEGEARIEPDLTLIFDVPLEVSQARMAGSRELDRFEREAADFHARVREAYLARARANPNRIRVINANRTIAEIQAELARILESMQP